MKKVVLGMAVIFVGTMFFTSCSSDNSALSQFSKRKYMKNFKKSKYQQEEVIDEYQYANTAVETEEKVALQQNFVMEEMEAVDDAEMVLLNDENIVANIKEEQSVVDYSSWNNYNRNADMAEAINYHNAKAEKNNLKLNNNSAQVNDIVLIILGIFIPPLAVYLYEDSITTNFWVDLILTFIFWVPGIILAFFVMFAGISFE